MSGPTRNKLRLLLAVVAFAGLGMGAYYIWSSDDAAVRNEIEQIKAEMKMAKQQAVDAGGSAAARTTFSRGLAAERRGDHLRANEQYEAAKQAFRGATHHYQRAHTLADSLAAANRRSETPPADTLAVTPAQLTEARQQADSIRQRMLVMKKAADRAGADSLAPVIYADAISTSTAARQEYQQDEYGGYTDARESFERASRLFESAEEKAADRHSADIRLKTVNELRRNIPSDSLPRQVTQLIQRAESLHTEAREAYEREDFAYAANLLKESGVIFMQARSLNDSLLEERRELAARAKYRTEAEAARQEMRSARSEIPSIQKQQPLYEKARTYERKGQQMYEREEFAKAAEQFSTAARHYRTIQEMRIPLSQARDIVHELVGRYQQALEEKNIYQLRDLLPGVDTHWWSSFFENASNVVASVDAGTLERTESGATVTIRVRVDYMDEKNRMEHETFRSVWTLKPDDGKWMITSASMR